jgi:hypothetical protein
MQHPRPQLGQVRPRALLYVSKARNGKQHAPYGTNWDVYALITGNGEEPRNNSWRSAECGTQQGLQWMEGRANT